MERHPLQVRCPPRFNPLLPVGFKAETVEHYQTFCTGNASSGRAEEANNLYASAAYATVINNTLSEALRELMRLKIISNLPDNIQGPAAETLNRFSDAQVAIFGSYELSASRYEVLCGRQGASGVADPDLLSA